MRVRDIYRLLTVVTLFLCVSVLRLFEISSWMRITAVSLAVVMLILLYVAMIRPMNTLTKGMDILLAQDFMSRLRTVGQIDADRLVALFNNMMERIKTERLRVTEQSNLLNKLIEVSPLGIALLDYDGYIAEANTAMARFLGRDLPCDIIGKSFSDLDDELAVRIMAVAVGKSATIRLGDMKILRCTHLSFMERGFERRFVIIESLTDEVLRAEKAAYGRMIRLIAHEVNNTMAGVNSLLQTLADVMNDSEAAADIVPVITSCHDRCDSLGRFITSYANVVKIPEPVLRRIDINSMVTSIFPFLETLSGGRTELRLHASAPVEVDADPVLFEQVMVNVVKNAIESIGDRPDGQIEITVRPDINGLEITDNGPGILPEATERLFTPFFSTKRGGQGIGLMMVSEILRRHNCRFSLRTDKEPPSLTRFRISFPRVRHTYDDGSVVNNLNHDQSSAVTA